MTTTTHAGRTYSITDNAPIESIVFDVTPAALVDAIVTERGVIERPDRAKLAAHMQVG